MFVLILDYHSDLVTKGLCGRGKLQDQATRVRGDDAILKRFTRRVCTLLIPILHVSVNAVTVAPGQCPRCPAAFCVCETSRKENGTHWWFCASEKRKHRHDTQTTVTQ